MNNFDNKFLSDKVNLIAGTDEAGRGPLAGPVVAAAVVFPPKTFIENISDSKKLSEKEREHLYPIILKKALAIGVSVISNKKIDKINILQASLLAMRKSVDKLQVTPNLILVDGNKTFNHEIPTKAIVKGDSKSFCIAAASIIAKVTRDNIMKKLHKKHPEYLWNKNKGYPTREHIRIIKQYGITDLHRKSFLKSILPNEFI